MNTTLDIGIMLPRDLPADQVLDYARAAETAGFAELWIVEDLGYRGGIAQTAAVLAATDHLTVGIGILPAGARNVAFAAMEIATLADLFPGRVHIGLGHGMPTWMRQVGAAPTSYLTLLDECLTALRALLTGRPVTQHGHYIHLDDVTIAPPAIVPPLLAGVRGPKSLALAGRLADGTVLAEPAGPEYIRAARETIAAAPHRVIAYNIGAVDPDPAVARTAARSRLTWIGDPDVDVHIAALPFATDLRELRARHADRTTFAAALPDTWVDQLAVTGTPDQARARLTKLADAGADAVVLIPAAGDPHAALHTLKAVLRG